MSDEKPERIILGVSLNPLYFSKPEKLIEITGTYSMPISFRAFLSKNM